MKKCEAYQGMIGEYIDNELDDAMMSGLFYHLGECAECRYTLRSMLQLRTALLEWDKTELNRSAVRPFWKRTIVLSLRAVAALAVFLILSVATIMLTVSEGIPSMERERREYVSSKPLPTYYVIEPKEQTFQMN